MGMCRIVLTNGKVMHLPAKAISLREGHLCLQDPDGGWRGAFAPGSWSHWIWVEMGVAAFPVRSA